MDVQYLKFYRKLKLSYQYAMLVLWSEGSKSMESHDSQVDSHPYDYT